MGAVEAILATPLELIALARGPVALTNATGDGRGEG